MKIFCNHVQMRHWHRCLTHTPTCCHCQTSAATGNDMPSRDPVHWRLDVWWTTSAGGDGQWITLDEQTAQVFPARRHTIWCPLQYTAASSELPRFSRFRLVCRGARDGKAADFLQLSRFMVVYPVREALRSYKHAASPVVPQPSQSLRAARVIPPPALPGQAAGAVSPVEASTEWSLEQTGGTLVSGVLGGYACPWVDVMPLSENVVGARAVAIGRHNVCVVVDDKQQLWARHTPSMD